MLEWLEKQDFNGADYITWKGVTATVEELIDSLERALSKGGG